MRKREVAWLLSVLAVTAMIFGAVARRDQGKDALESCTQNLKTLGVALEIYADANGGRFPGEGQWEHPYHGGLNLLVPAYLGSIPTCPAAQRDTYSETCITTWAPNSYVVACAGRWHAKAGMGRDSPRYTSTEGLLLESPDRTHALGGKLPRGVRLDGLYPGMTLEEVRSRLGPITLAQDGSYHNGLGEAYLTFGSGGRLRRVSGGTDVSSPAGSFRMDDLRDDPSRARAVLGVPTGLVRLGPGEYTEVYEGEEADLTLHYDYGIEHLSLASRED